MASYKLSPIAEQDLIDIYVRGIREWGNAKADRYQAQLISTFHMLADNPGIGHTVTIRPKLQRHEVAPYVVFYKKINYGVRIIRILYKNRAMERHL
ncbi:MAG: type II toxin-antitoxin system RelE/ParE family toxin [Proteobacteria bacterium]|nr:type II toxin-antitoxin system RelE/ParE family toxin [Pseudomonadota bacterium]